MQTQLLGPQGFWGSGENGYLFSGSWGALVIILGELGSKLIILGIAKSKKDHTIFVKKKSGGAWTPGPP